MGLFSSVPELHMSLGELRELLDSVSGLDNEEEEYILKQLEEYRLGGLSKEEITKAVGDMKYDYDDPVARDEAERVKKTLLEALEEE